MANTKSAIKAARKSKRLTARNRSSKTSLKTLAKAVTATAKGADIEKSRAAAISYSSALDRAVKANVIHPNAASRKKAKIAKYVFATKA